MHTSVLAPALGLAALASAQAAQAQQQACIMPADAADTVVYLMPVAYDGALKSCKKQFSDASFLPSDEGRSFIEKFREKQDAAWSGTYRVAQALIASRGGQDDGMSETLGKLSESELRPFADALVGQMIAEEITPDSCDRIDRGIELLSPLPAENVGGIVTFVLEMVDLGDSVPLCNADGTMRMPAKAGETQETGASMQRDEPGK
jgi:hypothetical protein